LNTIDLEYRETNGRRIDELKGFGRKLAWPNQGIISAFAWRD
jgi:hypothetical protein